MKQDGFVEGRKRSGYFVNQEVLTDPGHALKREVPADISATPERIDYRKFFTNRTFNLPRVVKPADCLVRYRYPFVCGLTDPSLFPIGSWRECVRDSVNVVEVRNWATDYSDIDDPMLVEQLIQRVLAKRGIVAHPDEILVTVGGQQALYLALRLLLSGSDILGVEDPGYPDVINMARIEGIEVLRLPVDRNGLVLSPDMGRCKCLFVTPSHQFPTTVTMPLERKLKLLQRTRRTTASSSLRTTTRPTSASTSAPPRALKSLDRWRATSSTPAAYPNRSCPDCASATWWPTGTSCAEARERFATICSAIPPVNNQRTVALVPAEGLLRPVRGETDACIYRQRCDVMYESLERHFPGAAVKPEYGGAIIWLRLPEEADANILRERVEPESVYFETGGFTFADENSNRNHIRLGYSVIEKSRIPEGIDRIANAVADAVAEPPGG